MAKTGKVLLQLAIIGSALAILATVKMPNHTQLWREINNSGHAILFGAMAVGFLALSLQLLGSKLARRCWHYWAAFAVTSFLGAITEFIQVFTARDADFYDLYMDILGAAAFLCIAAAFDPQLRVEPAKKRNRRRLWLTGFGLLLFALAFLSPALWASAMIARDSSFPVICGFDSYWETKWIKPIRATLERVPPPMGFTTAEGTVGHFITHDARFPKIEFFEVHPDWRGLSSLSLDVYSELDRPVNLALRIDDIHHNDRFVDRFNRRLVIYPGLNQFLIGIDEIRTAPRGREMDLEHITQVLIFGVYPSKPFAVFLDNFRLQ